MNSKPYTPPSDAEPTAASVSPAADPAESILRSAPELNDQQRETLWNVFHSKSTPEDLAAALDNFSASLDTKNRLWLAKKRTASDPTPVDRTRKAIESVSTLGREILEAAEKSPTVLKALVAAANVRGDSK